MNPPVGSRLLAALLCASALFTVAAASLPRFDLAVAAPFMNPSESPERSRAAMVERIGPPSRRLRAAVWIYYRCRAIGMPPVVGEGADIGVVNVSAGAVTDLGLLNEETLRVLVPPASSAALPLEARSATDSWASVVAVVGDLDCRRSVRQRHSRP